MMKKTAVITGADGGMGSEITKAVGNNQGRCVGRLSCDNGVLHQF